jgi:hypothetical protein
MTKDARTALDAKVSVQFFSEGEPSFLIGEVERVKDFERFYDLVFLPRIGDSICANLRTYKVTNVTLTDLGGVLTWAVTAVRRAT